jgi:hypothetical protein
MLIYMWYKLFDQTGCIYKRKCPGRGQAPQAQVEKVGAIYGTEKFVLSLSEHDLPESEELVLKRGPNFAVTNRMSNLDMVYAAESPSSKFPPVLGMEFCWRIRCMLKKSKPFTSYIIRKESMTLRSLKDNKKIIYPLEKETAR